MLDFLTRCRLERTPEFRPKKYVYAGNEFCNFFLLLVILARLFGYLALILATAFAALGVIFLLDLTLPVAVTAFAGVQALWWLAAAITLIIRSGKISNSVGKKELAVS